MLCSMTKQRMSLQETQDHILRGDDIETTLKTVSFGKGCSVK
jgi:hypothetical protein